MQAASLANAQELWQELPWQEPSEIFANVADAPFSLFLDGAYNAQQPISYIAFSPRRWLLANGHHCSDENGSKRTSDFFSVLSKEILNSASAQEKQDRFPFSGGWAGYIGYEAGGLLEKLPAPKAAGLMPDAAMAQYETLFAFDHKNQTAYGRGSAMANHWQKLCAPMRATIRPLFGLPQDLFPAYESDVEKILNYIKAGDIYQANLTRAIDLPIKQKGSAYALYQELRAVQRPAQGGFFKIDEGAILSLSPELFLEKINDTLTTRPIKGTAPRGKTTAEDLAAQNALLNSEKDRAENLMIVDLLRNDLSRVCETGSVEVPNLFALETYPDIHHLVSTIKGRLKPGLHPVDILRATFPGGSITGAPKIRAMQIIHELEPSPRGPYCGGLGYISDNGNMNFNILIRTLILTETRARLQVGAGIVADSEPTLEAAECAAKIAGILSTLQASA